eukprot:1159880-Pelagomonas_calceolata.AAC.9
MASGKRSSPQSLEWARGTAAQQVPCGLTGAPAAAGACPEGWVFLLYKRTGGRTIGPRGRPPAVGTHSSSGTHHRTRRTK